MAIKPVNSPTRIAEQRRKAALKEIEENGVHGLLANTKDTMVSTVTKFNELHAILAGVKGDISALCETESRILRDLTPLIGGDISFVTRSEGVTAKEVEDERCFATVLGKLANEPNKFVVLSRCVKVSEQLDTCIQSWNSKRLKLSQRTAGDGASEAELEVVRKKLEQVDYTVDQLKVRADTVSQLFYVTLEAIEKRLENYRKNFKSKFNNRKD